MFPIFLHVLSLRDTSSSEKYRNRRQGTEWGTRWFPLTAVRVVYLGMRENNISLPMALVAASADNASSSAMFAEQ